MVKYVLNRCVQLVCMLFVLSIIVFFMVRLIPGDPTLNMLGPGIDTSPETMEIERERLGLNKPIPVQYASYIKNLLKGDMGVSIVTKKGVWDEIKDRYPPTFILAVGGTILGALLGILMGIVAAVNHNKFWDTAIMALSMLAVSVPSFFLALILMLIFSLYLKWLPSIGLKSPVHMILPIITLGARATGMIARTTRSSMLDVINQDYIRTSRSRGVSERVVIYSHAFKNAMIPVLTAVGLRFGGLLAGATLVETVFSIPGVGRFLVDSVLKRDYPAIQGCILVLATTFVAVNTVVDLLYGIVDPRIKY